jgi:hypothetical protein
MGLLDDAIREHLDLKRRHGADPAEIEQAEREALGPVRRDPFERGGDESEPALAGAAYDQAAELDQPGVAEQGERDWGDAFGEEGAEDHAPPPPEPSGESSIPSPHPADAPVAEETAEYDVEEAFASEESLDVPEPERSRLEPHEPPAATHDEPPRGDEPEHGDERPHGDEDVLEETPEFLQDTPDHDRLWFEQRPPRDFDFDG